MAQDFQQILINGVLGFLEPVEQAATDPVARRDLLGSLGWETGAEAGFPEQSLISALSSIGAAISTLRQSLGTAPQSLSDVVAAFDAIRTGIKSIEQLAALTGQGAPADFGQVTLELLNLLLVNRIKNSRLGFYQLLRLLTVIEDQTTSIVVSSASPAIVQRRQVTFDHFNFDRIVELIQDPVGVLKREYDLQNGLTDPNATADLLFPRISALLNALNIDARYGVDPDRAVDFGTVGNDVLAHTLTFFKSIPSITDDVSAGFGAGLALEQDLGLLVQPFGVVTFADTVGRWLFEATLSADVPGVAISSSGVTFPTGTSATSATLSLQLTRVPASADEASSPDGTSFAAGSGQGTRLELGAFTVGVTATLSTQDHDFGFNVDTGKSALVISGGDGDGFLSSVLPAESKIDFQFSFGWSRKAGLRFSGSGSLELDLPVNFSIGGVVTVSGVRLRIVAASGALTAAGLANVAIALGPVTASAEGLGVGTTLTFPGQGGSLGPADATVGFQPPTGLGIAIDAGPVSGGGFITFDPANHRYFGALELSVYSVSVKAFGIIETKLPTGPGFSFLIIISAEFTPIQLGFGFTLLGVGGLAGINRTVDSDGLLAAIKKGDLDNVLFPTDVIDNAPAILHDLETIFPPVDGHFLFGPMAKIGWGTPTLVDGELGLILELPGPRLTVLGTVHAALPTADEAVVELNLDVGGVLDFPKKSFSLDASLHDSRVGDFPVSGDMSMRLTWGQDPNFALSIGGFNPHYNPPASFPKLNPVTVDLGENGNPSINLHGYMALTSNTAQVGAMLEARVSKGGADLYGFIGFDALFIFSPFSFTADIEGGVKVNFHGAGFSLHFHGTISGPSPWHLDGQVCVSILWWDACVGFSVTMGGESKPSLPGLDPWTGSAIKADGTQDVPGLQPALQNQANWGGNPPPGSFQVVTLLAPAKESDPPPVDPLGSATVQQKAAPLDVAISSFAGTKPSVSRTFDIKTVTIGQTVAGTPAVATTVSEPTRVSDLFAPAQFQAMKDADKLSSPSFIPMHGGFTISSSALSFGTAVPTGLTYDQFLLGTTGLSPKLSTTYDPSQDHVTAVTARSATATGGIRGAALARFVDPTALPKVTLIGEGYVLAQISTLKVAAGFSIDTPVSRPVAFAALLAAQITSATAVQTLQVMPSFNALR